jgi:osmotically-inducible protein OsmY
VSEQENIIGQVQAALEREPRVNCHKYPIRVQLFGGVLTLEGVVQNIAAKRRAVQLARAVVGVLAVQDELRVRAAEAFTDAVVRDRVCKALMQENAFHDCGVAAWVKGAVEVLRESGSPVECRFEVNVQDGTVFLRGRVPSLSHKRLAGVLAWWVAGSQDVRNDLEVYPPEQDNDDEIADAVRLVLEKDPMLRPLQLGVQARDGVVILHGAVSTSDEKDLAEHDAWYVDGVKGVDSRIVVRAT